MNSNDRIRVFLAGVRRLMRRSAGARAALYSVSLCALFAVAVPLLALRVAPHQSAAVLVLSSLGAGVALVGLFFTSVVRSLQQSRTDRDVARFVGRVRPELASDLASAVEFVGRSVRSDSTDADVIHTGGQGYGSEELMGAFLGQMSSRLAAIDPASLISKQPLQRASIACAAAAACLAFAVLLAPSSVHTGWQRVLDPKDTRPFGGARMSDTPLVEDIHITVDYPAYTERSPLTLPSSSGDVRAMPGSVITLETRALTQVRAARVLLEEPRGTVRDTHATGDRGASGNQLTASANPTEIAFDIQGERDLRTRFMVRTAARYRILLEGEDNTRRVETLTRTIELEPDQAPQVQLYAPGDEIDVAGLKRVELAYIAEDDYGISRIDLVWVKDGEAARKSLLANDEPQRTAQGKVLWDLAAISLEPGARISYFLEVADNDTVTGPNIGRSREFKLRVFSPREKHETLVLRQRALLERVLHALGGRLTVTAEDLHAHQGLQREAADLVIELGTLAAGLREDELADHDLRETLDEMRSRLDKLAKAEATLLGKLFDRQKRGGKPAFARLTSSDTQAVSELEDDAVVLSNWIERQQMENLLAITDDVGVHQDRLRQLFKEYQRTGSYELVAEIERELRALEKRLAEMALERSHLADDVLDRFVHSDAIQERQTTDCMGEVRALMSAGKVDQAETRLGECMGTIDRATAAMERALSELRGDTFSEEERRFGEAMDKLADLTHEQSEVADAAQEIWDRYAARADELMREEAKETRKRVTKLLERIRKQVAELPEDGLTPFAQEEMEIVEARLADVDRMLADGDIAEAMAMAEQGRMGVETSAADMDAAMHDQMEEPWHKSTKETRRDLGRIQSMIDKLVAELSASTPSPAEIMSQDDRRQLARLGRRQQSVSERARRLADRAKKTAQDLPGRSGETLAEGVDGARSHMERANKHMRTNEPSGARQESQSAAEAMQRTVKATRDAARGRQPTGRAGLRDEPIRIPGADEYRAPEKFREDILEAMKREQAPQGFGSLVKRYYEELIR